jgi:hypothetical protein
MRFKPPRSALLVACFSVPDGMIASSVLARYFLYFSKIFSVFKGSAQK